jgi:hypothetical protein
VRRIGRILIDVAAVVSLAVCLATTALWVRSVTVRDELVRIDRMPRGFTRWTRIISHRGVIAWGAEPPSRRIYEMLTIRAEAWHYHRGFSMTNGPLPRELVWKPSRVQEYGFIFHAGEQPILDAVGLSFAPDRVVALPHWSLVLSTALLPAFVGGRRYRGARRLRRGLCPACGYDRRATPDRCPECGAPAPARAADEPGLRRGEGDER